MTGALAQLPDTTRLLRLAGQAASGGAAVAQGYEAMATVGAGSPVAGLSGALVDVRGSATVDLTGLAGMLGTALGTVSAALPAALLEQAGALAGAYDRATAVLAHNPLLERLPEGGALRDVAAQVIDEAVALLEHRMVEFGERALPPGDLAELLAVFEVVEGLRTDFPAHAAALPGFVAGTVLGFVPEVLGPLRALVAGADPVALALDPAALDALLGPGRRAASEALAAVEARIAALDPALPAGFDALDAALDAAAAAARTAADVLRGLYGAVDATVAAHAWTEVVPGYVALLAAVDLRPRMLVDDVLEATASLLDELIEGAHAAVAGDEIAARVEAFGAGLRSAVAGAGVGQARQAVLDVLDDVRGAVAAVPLAQAREAVGDALGRVGQQLAGLGLDVAAETVEAGFAALESSVVQTVARVGSGIREGLADVLQQLDQIPTEDLLTALGEALAAVRGVVDRVGAAAQEAVADLREQLGALEQLSFRPVSDEVVGEIDELRGRLAAMDPDTLSEEGKLAVRAALAVLAALDVEDKVVKVLGEQFHALQGRVREVLDEVAARLARVRSSLEELRPDALLAPVTAAFGTVEHRLAALDAAALLTPVRAELAQVDDWLAGLDPGALLAPLQGPYGAAVALLHQLDPQGWGAPLGRLHRQLADVSARLDLTPLFLDLDERRRDLLESARDAVTGALERLDLPEPLGAWLARVRVLFEGITELLLLDPVAGMRGLGAQVQASFTPASLYEPLGSVLDAALAALGAVPVGALVEAATGVRDDVVAALDELEPAHLVARLRAAHRRLVEAAPAAQLPRPEALTGLRLALHVKVDGALSVPQGRVARVDARLDVLAALLDPAEPVVRALAQQQDRALAGLRTGIDALAVQPAQAAFEQLRTTLETLIPPELPRTGPVTVADVLAATDRWRPAGRAAALDTRLAAFLDELRPAADRLAGAFDRLGEDLRAAAGLIDPLALAGPVAEVFDAVRAQVDALDPTTLLAQLRTEVYEPVAAAVEALDPAVLAARLDLAYSHAREAVMGQIAGLVHDVQAALQAHLDQARALVKAALADVQQTLAQATTALAEVVEAVGDLVFVELVDRLRGVLDNLGTSFDAELERIRHAFDAMLDAAPVGRPSGAAA